jgi:hypothetical protein
VLSAAGKGGRGGGGGGGQQLPLRPIPLHDRPTTDARAGLGDPGDWETFASAPFVDAATSPALWRALYVPGASAARVRVVDYVLLRRVANSTAAAPVDA